VCYDAAGNVIFDNQLGAAGDRTYDAENRMVTAAGGGANSYGYNADGKRVRRAVGAQTFWQVYGVGGELVAEYLWNGATATLQKEHGYRAGEMLIVAEGATVRWLVKDHLGTPRILADQTGSLGGIRRHDYLPFGEETLAGAQRSGNGYQAEGVRQKFTGYERDAETELDNAEARYYSATQGRFASIDSLLASARRQTPQSWNRFIYVINNPQKYVDPSGLDWIVGPGGNTFFDPNVSGIDAVRKKYGKGFEIINGHTRVITNSNHPGLISGHYYTFHHNGTTTDHGVYAPPPPPSLPRVDADVELALSLIEVYYAAPIGLILGGVPATLTGAVVGSATIAAEFSLSEDAPDPLTISATTIGVGPYATEGVPSPGPVVDPNSSEQKRINEIGNRSGCHTCGVGTPGTKSGNWIADHQPPNALNPQGGSQMLYPHCLPCSRRQFGEVGRVRRMIKSLLRRGAK
jgi:RHS repeat-associated protein